MRRRYVLTLFAAGMLVIFAIAKGTGTESKNLTGSPVASPPASPTVIGCNSTDGTASPPQHIKNEISGTPIPGSSTSSVLWLYRMTFDGGASSDNLCYPGWWLFRVDSGKFKLTIIDGCVIVTRFSSLPPPSPTPNGCDPGKFGPGSEVELGVRDEFFAEDGRFVLHNETNQKAVLLVAALALPNISCGAVPCP